MRDMSYDEKMIEIQKAIYSDSAKSIWDKTFEIFENELDPTDICLISHELVTAIEMESRYNTNKSIFCLLFLNEDYEQVTFLHEYIAHLHTSCGFNCINFIQENIDTLCKDGNFKRLVQHTKEITEIIGLDLIYLVDGGYFNESKWHYLTNYGASKIWKTAIKYIVNNRTIWKLKHDGYGIWENDEDIVLYDVAFVWNPRCGYSRFIDNNGKWGFINVINGKTHYMPPYVQHIRDYSYGRVAYQDKNNGLYGFVDIQGNIIIEPKFRTVMDFIKISEEPTAVVEFSYRHQYELCHDLSRLTPWGKPRKMGISIFEQIITINTDGNLTPEIQKIYDNEVAAYNEKILKEEETQIKEIEKQEERELTKLLLSNDGDIIGFW